MYYQYYSNKGSRTGASLRVLGRRDNLLIIDYPTRSDYTTGTVLLYNYRQHLLYHPF